MVCRSVHVRRGATLGEGSERRGHASPRYSPINPHHLPATLLYERVLGGGSGGVLLSFGGGYEAVARNVS